MRRRRSPSARGSSTRTPPASYQVVPAGAHLCAAVLTASGRMRRTVELHGRRWSRAGPPPARGAGDVATLIADR